MRSLTTDSIVHVLDETIEDIPNAADGKRLGRTWCGREVRGWVDPVKPEDIYCGNCERILISRGYPTHY